MRNLILFFSILSGLLISENSYSAGIKGSKHDFSRYIWSDGEICLPCHTPHTRNPVSADAPLWDRNLTTQTFIPYTSKTMKAAVGQPDGLSKLCLSCHDGTIAIDSFDGRVGTTFIRGKIGPNLLSGQGHWKHPISIVYDTNLSVADKRIYDPSTRPTSIGGTVQKTLLFNDKVQCSSCHDVHNTATSGTLLRIPENTLCKTCHK